MTNGIVELKGVEKKYILRFGYQACMEFERRSISSMTASAGQNNITLASDIIYAGLYGEALRNEKPIPKYSDAVDLIDDLSETDNLSEQIESVWDVYNESKWGKDFRKR